jgi:hypothetical protein
VLVIGMAFSLSGLPSSLTTVDRDDDEKSEKSEKEKDKEKEKEANEGLAPAARRGRLLLLASLWQGRLAPPPRALPVPRPPPAAVPPPTVRLLI